MRVGPITPMTPASAPRRYEAVTSVKRASFGSRCSLPMVIVSPWPSRWASASRSRSRRSVTSMSPCSRSLVANSGWPARSCALPSTTPTPAFPAVGMSNSSSASWMKIVGTSLESASGGASRSRSGRVPRISRNVSPASRSFNTTPTWATASGANCAGTSTKIDRTTPLLRVSTNNSRSDDACSSSSRSSPDPLEHRRIERRTDGDAELLRQHPQHLGRALEDLVHRRMLAQPFADLVRLRRRDGRQPHQRVDVDSIREIGGDPAGGGVGVVEVPLLLQVAHGVADGGGRQGEPETLRDSATPRRLGGFDVGLDDGFEDLTLALVEGCCHISQAVTC